MSKKTFIRKKGATVNALTLQPMRRNHLASCARLYAAVFNNDPWDGRWTTRTARKHIQDTFGNPNFRGIVGLGDHELVGFAYGSISQWENECRFYLHEMCVLGRKQGAGVGTRLLTRLIRRLKAEKISQISLGTERDKPAKDFYLKLGFEVDPSIIIMSKGLTRGR